MRHSIDVGMDVFDDAGHGLAIVGDGAHIEPCHRIHQGVVAQVNMAERFAYKFSLSS